MTKHDRTRQISRSVSLRVSNITSLESCGIITTRMSPQQFKMTEARTQLKKPFLPSSRCEVDQGTDPAEDSPTKGKPVATLQMDMSCSSHAAAQTLVQV